MNGKIDFSELAVGGWIGFPMSCMSGYLFLWDQYLPAPSVEPPKKAPEVLVRKELKKYKRER